MSSIIFKNEKHKKWAEDILGYKFPGKELKFQTDAEMKHFIGLLDSRSFTEQLNPIKLDTNLDTGKNTFLSNPFILN